MAGFVYQDPKIGSAFETLAGVLGRPRGLDVVKASVLRAQRENLEAEAVTRQTQAAMYQNELASTQQAQALLASNPDLADPANRARLAGFTYGMRDGLQHGPQAAAGMTTFVQPNALDQNQLSNVLLGTGVVRQYQDTPAGLNITGEQTLARQRLANEGALAVANVRGDAARDTAEIRADGAVDAAAARGANGGSRATVSPNTAARLWQSIVTRIGAEQGVDPVNIEVPPETRDHLLGIATDTYQRTKNAEAAVEEAYMAAPRGERTDWSFLPTSRKLALPKTSGAANVAAGADAAARIVQSSGAGPQGAPGEGRTAVNRKTGQVIVFRGGQWVDQRTGAPVQ